MCQWKCFHVVPADSLTHPGGIQPSVILLSHTCAAAAKSKCLPWKHSVLPLWLWDSKHLWMLVITGLVAGCCVIIGTMKAWWSNYCKLYIKTRKIVCLLTENHMKPGSVKSACFYLRARDHNNGKRSGVSPETENVAAEGLLCVSRVSRLLGHT